MRNIPHFLPRVVQNVIAIIPRFYWPAFDSSEYKTGHQNHLLHLEYFESVNLNLQACLFRKLYSWSIHKLLSQDFQCFIDHVFNAF